MKSKLLGLILIILIVMPLMSACKSTNFEDRWPMPPLKEGEIPTSWTCKYTQGWGDGHIVETWECHWELIK